MDFSGKSKHRYDKSTGFLLNKGEESMDGHSLTCREEAGFYHSATMKVARKKYRDKKEESKKLAGDEGVAPGVENEPEVKLKKNLKRKAESDVPKKNVKKKQKRKRGLNTYKKKVH